MSKTKILIADDDRNICEILRMYVEKEGYEAHIVHDGAKVMDSFREITPSLALLDIMMPGTDGLQICREIRRISNIPVIMLTAKGETFDKVLGLELGADDYVVKPFEAKELMARIKAVMRRYDTKQTNDKEIVYPNLKINLSNYELNVVGENVDIPPKEMELLFFLASKPNRVFTREQLLDQIWGYDYFGDSRTVDVHVKRLREKIDVEGQVWQLKTVWGVGYKFEVK